MGWGSSTRRGGGRKLRARPRNFVFLGFRREGCPGNFAGMSRTPGSVQKVCAKKLRAHFSFPSVCVLRRGVLRRVFREEVTQWKAPREVAI